MPLLPMACGVGTQAAPAACAAGAPGVQPPVGGLVVVGHAPQSASAYRRTVARRSAFHISEDGYMELLAVIATILKYTFLVALGVEAALIVRALVRLARDKARVAEVPPKG